MRVKRFSVVAEFVELFAASGLQKRLIEVMLGLSSPRLAFHFVNRGVFSGNGSAVKKKKNISAL